MPGAEAWPLLLASLKSSCPKVQLQAAKAVNEVASCCPRQCQAAVILSGGLPHLITNAERR